MHAGLLASSLAWLASQRADSVLSQESHDCALRMVQSGCLQLGIVSVPHVGMTIRQQAIKIYRRSFSL